MSHRITQVKISNFRGATQPVTVKFEPAKNQPKTNVVVLFGENGTGKSTIVDALDAAGNSSFGSLHRGGIQAPQKHVASLGRDAKAVEIEVTTRAGHTCRATVGSRSIIVTPTSEGAVLPGIRVLRRRDLLKLIDAKAAERYQEIEKFVAVHGVDAAEAALRLDLSAVKRTVETAGSAKAQAEKSLQAFWEQERQPEEPGTDAVAWAKRRTAEDVLDLQNQRDRAATAQTLLASLAAAVEQWQLAGTGRQEAQNKADVAESELAEVNQGAPERNTELIEMLNAAQRYLAPPSEPQTCPLCANDVQAKILRQSIQQQLGLLQSARAALQALNNARAELKKITDTCARYGREVLRLAKPLMAHLATDAPTAVGVLGLDWQKLNAELATAEADDTVCTRIAGLVERLHTVSEAAQHDLERLRVRLTLHDNIKRQVDLLDKSIAEVAGVFAVEERLKSALNVLVENRRNFVQAILDEIIDEVNALYEAIHPNEKASLYRLELDEVKRASLEPQARFENHNGILPQAYFSESHLDTFGFCLWLALAKRGNPQNVVLVLDDVFTSVDTQHFRRISDLLAEQAPQFQQLIIATHNRLWHEYYKTSGVSVHLIKLERWTLARGLRPHEEQVVLAELAEALNAEVFDRQAVASKAGVLLENVLENLAVHYGCSIKLKPGHAYTLGDLLNSTKSLFKKAKIRRVLRDDRGVPVEPDRPESWQELVLEPHFQRLDALRPIRNEVGAHFNLGAADWADEDVHEFGQAAYELAEALACHECGHLPKNPRTDHRGCRCDKHQTQLYPLSLN